MPPTSDPSISDEVLQEGCYYLSKMGMKTEIIAHHFETTPARVRRLVRDYSAKLKSGTVEAGEIDRAFWEDVRKEAEGDVKLTFLSDKGFHHSWKSELAKLDGTALMSIYERSRDFLSADPNQKFLEFPPPKGYDPLAMDRELRKAIVVLGELLEARWKSEKGSTDSKSPKLN